MDLFWDTLKLPFEKLMQGRHSTNIAEIELARAASDQEHGWIRQSLKIYLQGHTLGHTLFEKFQQPSFKEM